MAKGNTKKTQELIDKYGAESRSSTDRLRSNTENLYNYGAGRNIADYERLMGQYDDWTKTGGYSPDDISNIRARNSAPFRSVYSNAERELDRNKALQGGYSPNYAAASAKMAREMSQGLSDANRNVEGDIAQMVHQGKLQGLQGASQLYGTTPGLASTFGSQNLQAQQMMNQLNLGLIDAQMGNKGGFNWGGFLSGAGSLLGAGMGLFDKLPFFPGGGKGHPDEKTKSAAPAGGGGGSTPAPDYLTGANFGQEQQPIPSTNLPQDTSKPLQPDVTTETTLKTLPVNKPNGGQGQAELIPGTTPPMYMDEEYNYYDQEGNYLGNLLTGES